MSIANEFAEANLLADFAGRSSASGANAFLLSVALALDEERDDEEDEENPCSSCPSGDDSNDEENKENDGE